MSDIADRIRNARFKPVRLSEGYDMGEVDRFLDRLEQAHAGGEPLAPLVAQARFGSVRLREGYDMREVDAFLDELAATDRPDTAAPAPAIEPQPSGTQPSVVQPSVVQEQRGLLGRLFGRR